MNSAGTSILENAASNRDFWDRWHINIGFNRLELDTTEKLKVSYRIMPFALGSTFYGFTQGKLDINESLKIGTPTPNKSLNFYFACIYPFKMLNFNVLILNELYVITYILTYI